MPDNKIASYGSWKSPISSDLIVSETVRLSDVVLDGRDVFWVEMRPSEGGRNVIVRCTPDGQKTDITPADFNARTRVHEYGGRSFIVDNADIYFSNYSDHQIYFQRPDSAPAPITSGTDLHFADMIYDRRRPSLICVCEDHRNQKAEPENKLIRLNLTDKNDTGDQPLNVLVAGSDFYASPCLSPDGSQLAWLSWNHPNMPWDGTELWVARLGQDGALENAKKAAGGTEESIFQPQWSPDGTLYFVSDRTGWWNICRWENNQITPLAPMEAEFGLPQWVFGMSTYAFESDQRLICAFTQKGRWRLAEINLTTDKIEVIETPDTDIAYDMVVGMAFS